MVTGVQTCALPILEALFGGDVHEHRITTVLLGNQTVLGELATDLVRVGALLPFPPLKPNTMGHRCPKNTATTLIIAANLPNNSFDALPAGVKHLTASIYLHI